MQEQALQHVSDRLVELAELRPRQRVLDIGTGIGEPAITASRRVGPAGYVLATDQSPQMLAIARERAGILQLANLDFQEFDAEAIAFPDSSFDAILSRFSLMFLPDVADVLTRIRLMLMPGGKFAAAVWDVAARVPMFSFALDLARNVFRLPPPPAGMPSIFGLAEGILEQAMNQAGFVKVHAEPLRCVLELPSAEAFKQLLRDVNVPLVNILNMQPEEGQAEYWRVFTVALQKYVTADGSIHMPGTAICVAGQR